MKKEGFEWKSASGFHKFIFCLGWINAGNLLFWVIFLIVFGVNQKKYRDFFNTKTFMVPYIFGWITFVVLILLFIMMILAAIIVFLIGIS